MLDIFHPRTKILLQYTTNPRPGVTTMTDLDKAISAAFASKGKQDDVNKVYLLLLRSLLFIPVSKEKKPNNEELFSPLFTKIENRYYMLAFDTLERLTSWAGEHMAEMGYVELSGHDLIKGINDQACFSLNVGTPYYKEFLPDEIKRLKTIVSRIEQMKQG